MKLISVDRDVHEILKSGYFRIPRFQRPYSWTKENVEDFWNDVVVEPVPGYFIGSIVVFKRDRHSHGLVDGQQRLTTITILLCVLRDAFKKEGMVGPANGLHALIERPDLGDKMQYVLQPETSYPFFQERIQNPDGTR